MKAVPNKNDGLLYSNSDSLSLEVNKCNCLNVSPILGFSFTRT